MKVYKKCTKCGKSKPFFDYHVSKRYSDGRVQRCKICVREYAKKHYDENSVKHKEYNLANAAMRDAYHKRYRLEHKNKERKNAIGRMRRRIDAEFKISSACRRRLYNALNYKGTKKTVSSMILIGCTIDFLRGYLEARFLPGMTWENHGTYGWHIDHIFPCSSFDLEDIEQQHKCFHYTNLQPLWAADNIRKSDSMPVCQ